MSLRHCTSPRCGATRAPRRYPITVGSQAKLVVNAIHKPSPFQYVTEELGFLPVPDPVQRLALCRQDPAAAEWEAALRDIPKLAVAAAGAGAGNVRQTTGGGKAGRGALRRVLESLPPFPTNHLMSYTGTTAVSSAGGSGAETGPGSTAVESESGAGELWRAYLLMSFLAHAYIWCEPGPPPAVLPAVLAVPWVRIAAAVDMPPVLTYASYNLYNWRRLDPNSPVRLGNIVCLQNFLGGPDEEWFRLVHVDIEARAGRALAGLCDMQRAASEDNADAVLAGLVLISEALREMQGTLARMGEQCDPYIYYQRVRTPMSGWRNNPDLPRGLVYEGVSSEPVQLYGETGAQSSVLHAFDAALSVQHDQGWLRGYLDTMVLHMPPHHRTFLETLTAANGNDGTSKNNIDSGGGANVRSYVQRRTAGGGGGNELLDAYNAAIEEMERFRSQHRAFAQSYIAKWARGPETAGVGTGGSDFMPALTGYRDTTSRHVLGG